MARKTYETDPRIGNDQVGLMITRGQIEHLGHAALKAQMLVDNSRNIVGFGSCQKSGVHGNPLTPDQKRRAQTGLWGDSFKMIFLEDIGATDRSTDWGDYVFDRIRSNQLPVPTDLYAGSVHEARWYEHHFASLKGAPKMQRAGFQVWENPGTGRRIHILDRTANAISSSGIRTMIEQRDPCWRDHVPAKLWDYYDWEYPPHLRSAIRIEENSPADGAEHGAVLAALPGADHFPVGTKCFFANDPSRILMLRADGKWRPKTDADDAKSLGD